jgi:hypothetical protein
MQMAVRAMLMRSVAAAVLLLQAGQGLAQVPADTNDLDSIQRALDQAKAAQAAAARKKAASAAANRKQRQAQPAAPPDMDLATERQRMAPSYKAIGLAWDNRGAWAFSTSDTVVHAKQLALSACNAHESDCYDSGLAISPGSRFCFAVSKDSAGKLSQASRIDVATARESSLGQCSKYGTECVIAYSGCNDH